jgi:hypothetical protein
MMILSDALSRRADAEELKEKDRTTTLLPSHLFVNLLDMEFSDLLAKVKDSNYDELVLMCLHFLMEEPDAEDSDWAVQMIKGRPIIFYKGKRYVPRDPELRRKILQEYHDHPIAGHPSAATTSTLRATIGGQE